MLDEQNIAAGPQQVNNGVAGTPVTGRPSRAEKSESQQNKLMEHKNEQSPDEKHPYNFGFGTGGPYVRPAKSAEQKEKHTDAGLVDNTLEFLAELERRFPV